MQLSARLELKETHREDGVENVEHSIRMTKDLVLSRQHYRCKSCGLKRINIGILTILEEQSK